LKILSTFFSRKEFFIFIFFKGMLLKYNNTMTILCIIVSLRRSIFLVCEVHSGILDKLTITNARRMHFNLPHQRRLSILRDWFFFFFFRFIRQSVFFQARDIRILRLTRHEPAHGKFRKGSTEQRMRKSFSLSPTLVLSMLHRISINIIRRS